MEMYKSGTDRTIASGFVTKGYNSRTAVVGVASYSVSARHIII